MDFGIGATAIKRGDDDHCEPRNGCSQVGNKGWDSALPQLEYRGRTGIVKQTCLPGASFPSVASILLSGLGQSLEHDDEGVHGSGKGC